ncbi:MAG: hypothetical protein Q8Q03_00585 [bacterium]|nr:hypothetical protein [bacterium]
MKKYYKYGAVITLIGIIGIGVYAVYWEFPKPMFEVYFFHLERGRAVFIRTPNGKTVLIDGGQNSQILREITAVTPFYKRRIDTVILTNSAPKNVGGLADIVKRYEVGKVIEPEMMGTSTALEAFETAWAVKGGVVKKVKKGDEFIIDGIKFRVLFPDLLFKYNKTSLPEMVLEIEYGETRLLLLGDVSKTIQKSLIAEIDKVNVVEYAHGGANSRVSPDLLEKINPDSIVNSKRDGRIYFSFK